jgi:hypothetical protein
MSGQDIWRIVWQSSIVGLVVTISLITYNALPAGFFFISTFWTATVITAVIMLLKGLNFFRSVKDWAQILLATFAYVLAIVVVAHALDAPLILLPGGEFIFSTDDPRQGLVLIPLVALAGLTAIALAGWYQTSASRTIVTVIYILTLLVGIANIVLARHAPLLHYQLRSAYEGPSTERVLVNSYRQRIKAEDLKKKALESTASVRPLTEAEKLELERADKEIKRLERMMRIEVEKTKAPARLVSLRIVEMQCEQERAPYFKELRELEKKLVEGKHLTKAESGRIDEINRKLDELDAACALRKAKFNTEKKTALRTPAVGKKHSSRPAAPLMRPIIPKVRWITAYPGQKTPRCVIRPQGYRLNTFIKHPTGKVWMQNDNNPPYMDWAGKRIRLQGKKLCVLRSNEKFPIVVEVRFTKLR